jgi:hypothetical protein
VDGPRGGPAAREHCGARTGSRTDGKEQLGATHSLDLEPWVATGRLADAAQHELHTDPLPHGIAASRHVLDTISRYLVEQGLTKRKIIPDDIFAASTLDL